MTITREYPGPLAQRNRRVGALMAFEVVTLAVASLLHLSGALDSSSNRYAGVAEAVIGVALAYGAYGVLRSTPQARSVALAMTGFAIFGFVVGLSITARGGSIPNVVYHVTMLPILIATFVLLLRRTGPSTPIT